MIRYIQKYPHGARRLGRRKKLTWFRIAQVFGFSQGDENKPSGFQIWTEWKLDDSSDPNDPLYAYHCARSALERTSEYRDRSDLDDLAAQLSLEPKRRRRDKIAVLRQTAYREQHRPKCEVPTKLTPVQRSEAIQRCLAGESNATIARSLGVSSEYIRQLKFKYQR